MMKIESFEKLIVWQKAIDLVTDCYILLRQFPKEETYALCDQIRRACVSIPSNIAEGQSRNNIKEYIQFLGIAQGSRAELYTQLIIGKRLGYINDNEFLDITFKVNEIGKMLTVLIQSLKLKII